mgnify:CR=1 FL=1
MISARAWCPRALSFLLAISYLRLPLKACNPAHIVYSEVASPIVTPIRKASRVHAYYVRFQLPYATWDKPSTSDPTNPNWKGEWYHVKDRLYVHFVCRYWCKFEIQSRLHHGFPPKQNILIISQAPKNWLPWSWIAWKSIRIWPPLWLLWNPLPFTASILPTSCLPTNNWCLIGPTSSVSIRYWLQITVNLLSGCPRQILWALLSLQISQGLAGLNVPLGVAANTALHKYQ